MHLCSWLAQHLLASCQNHLDWTPVWNARQWESFCILLNKGVYQQAVQTGKKNSYKKNQVNHPSGNSLPHRRGPEG